MNKLSQNVMKWKETPKVIYERQLSVSKRGEKNHISFLEKEREGQKEREKERCNQDKEM